MGTKRPNILFFFTDQQRWDTCGCFNPNLNLTPNLDQLADDGACFEKTYTCQPVCGPARACLQSGMYATETGNFHNLRRLEPESCTPLAEYLNRAGYKTGYIGKLHLAQTTDGPVPPELHYGYKDYWRAMDVVEWGSLPYEGGLYDEEGRLVPYKNQYRVDFTTDLLLEFLGQQKDSEQPFFTMMSLIEPHHQNCMYRYVAPDGYAEQYQDAWVPGDLAVRRGQGDWEKNLPDYYGMIRRIDENLGRVVEALKKNGQYENTYIIFSSDHGSHFRTRNGEYKRACHDACTHIPLVIHGPDIKRGYREDKRLASLIDIPATILDMAGVDKPRHYRGRSLLPLMKGEDVRWRAEVFIQISESQVGRAVCDGRYKYSVSAPGADGFAVPGADIYREEFLYDLEDDPDENVNLVADISYKGVRSRLRRAMLGYIEEVEHYTPEILPAECR